MIPFEFTAQWTRSLSEDTLNRRVRVSVGVAEG
jgi:hypothetical protein